LSFFIFLLLLLCACAARACALLSLGTNTPPIYFRKKPKVLRVPVAEFEERLMLGGDMLLPSMTTGFLALRRLRAMGLID
jgi:hypothetical protein